MWNQIIFWSNPAWASLNSVTLESANSWGKKSTTLLWWTSTQGHSLAPSAICKYRYCLLHNWLGHLSAYSLWITRTRLTFGHLESLCTRCAQGSTRSPKRTDQSKFTITLSRAPLLVWSDHPSFQSNALISSPDGKSFLLLLTPVVFRKSRARDGAQSTCWCIPSFSSSSPKSTSARSTSPGFRNTNRDKAKWREKTLRNNLIWAQWVSCPEMAHFYDN